MEVAEMETRLSMLMSSGDKLNINFGEAVDENAQLSRRHRSVWDDDEDVEY